MKKLILIFIISLPSLSFALNKDSISTIKGVVFEPYLYLATLPDNYAIDYELVPFANVELFYNDSLIANIQTGFDGIFQFNGLSKYNIKQLFIKVVCLGYKPEILKDLHPSMKIKLEDNGSIIRDGFWSPPPAIDEYDHVNTTMHKGDTPYW